MKKDLKNSELLSHFTIERASDAIFWVDSNARFHFVNEAACRSLGYTRDEFMQMTVHDIDPDFPDEKWPEQWDRVKKLQSFIHLSHHRTKEGHVFPVEISANYLEFEGNEYSCAFVRDISKRLDAEKEVRDSEKRFRDIFSSVNDGIIIVDPDDGKIVDVNEKVMKMLGYKKNELIGMSVSNIHPDEIEQINSIVGEVLKGSPVLTDEFSCLRKDREYMPADMSFSRVTLNDVHYILIMVPDIFRL